MGALTSRRQYTAKRMGELRSLLGSAEPIANGKASLFATGSFGRREASAHSDIDLFIVGKSDAKGESLLRPLDEICLKAEVIEVTRALSFPEFSQNGRYFTHFPVREFTRTLGTPEDDVTNTFTARLLLLLESQPLLEPVVYKEVTEEVVAAYWRDYEDNKGDFRPAFLANDILRLWRTFCVNYEARTERKPEDEKAKGKLKNYKLKHSRLLTCYSALLFLLAVHRIANTVGPSDALRMISLSPTERLEWLLERRELAESHATILDLIGRYDKFLEATDAPEPELVKRFMDKSTSRAYLEAANEFGESVFEALTSVGGGGPFHRLLVV